jgi:hypothetical protein
MFVVFMVVACASAKPKPLVVAPVAYSAPVVAAAAPVVTAHSSQYFARNYNGVAAPLVAAPLNAAYTAPLAYSAPLTAAAYTAPLAYSAYSPYAGYSPYSAAYSPYSAAYVL